MSGVADLPVRRLEELDERRPVTWRPVARVTWERIATWSEYTTGSVTLHNAEHELVGWGVVAVGEAERGEPLVELPESLLAWSTDRTVLEAIRREATR